MPFRSDAVRRLTDDGQAVVSIHFQTENDHMRPTRSIAGLAGFLLVGLSVGCSSSSGGDVDSVALRSEATSLDKAALLESFKSKHLYCPGESISGGLTLKNRFEAVQLSDKKVVNDHVTKLIWQQDEDSTRFSWKEATAHVAKMNEEKFAGHADWRLPTAEELASLLTPKKNGEYFVDPLFHKELLSTWTADEVEGMPLGAWFIDFYQGKPFDGNRAAGMGHVRLVRGM
jgi:hypothetical protein